MMKCNTKDSEMTVLKKIRMITRRAVVNGKSFEKRSHDDDDESLNENGNEI